MLLDSILDNCPNLNHLNVDTHDSSARPQSFLKACQQGQTELESLTLELYYAEQGHIVREMTLLLSDPSSKPLRHISVDIGEWNILSIDD